MKKDIALNEFKNYYDSFIEDYKNILRIPSVLEEFNPENTEAPFGNSIREALDFMMELGQRDGFKTTNLDNYGGLIEFGEGEENILILCHLDVVPTTGDWTNPPFEPVIKDGRIYARGSLDDKGPLMALYYALKMLKDQGYTPTKKIQFFVGCDEESGSRCLEHFIEKYNPKCDYGFSPDADYPCIFAEKGISGLLVNGKCENKDVISFECGTAANIVPDKATATLSLKLEKEFKEYLAQKNLEGEVNGNEYTVYGLAAHGSIPETGINAALYLLDFISKYSNNELAKFSNKYLFEDPYGIKMGFDIYDEEMGKVSNNPGIIKMNNGEFSIVLNMRYPKNFNFEERVNNAKEMVKNDGCELSVLSNSPYHYVPTDSKLIKDLMKSYLYWTSDMGYSEEDKKPISIGGGTYARDFKNAVAFGVVLPHEEQRMHMPDESANISNIILSVFIYKDAIKNLCD